MIALLSLWLACVRYWGCGWRLCVIGPVGWVRGACRRLKSLIANSSRTGNPSSKKGLQNFFLLAQLVFQ